ncbi:helix-turn-helix domain-containing protein [Actinomycetospora chiangmaiensis]|uniref:helix-turn-helix domain-containing protein n=1 Tax=Actinomycetospora chiangmaiensis TaxID=402650 RepID=UPI00037B21C5|nr:AraC family transcriptional regulator [Actinomycetospora chiangmaiensis]
MARADPVVARFEQWVRSHLDDHGGVPVAARALGVSERTLQRATASALGVSPLDFITAIRVEHAAHLLRTTDLSTEAVAERVGYANASTLRSVVRRHRGVTVRELRAGPSVA